jgi:hypothetical protein
MAYESAVECRRCAYKDGDETFQLLHLEWDIEEAKRLVEAKPHEVRPLRIADLDGLLRWIAVDREHATHVPTDQPVIVAIVPKMAADGGDAIIPIDGWHRIARAGMEGRETVPAVMLTRAESIKVMVDRMKVARRAKGRKR